MSNVCMEQTYLEDVEFVFSTNITKDLRFVASFDV